MACVAKRSTTVKKAVKPITIVRRSTPEGPGISMATTSKGTVCGMSESSVLQGKQCDTSLWFGCHSGSNDHAKSHVVIVLVVHHVAYKQDDGLISEVLPPMRGAAGLRPDFPGFVHDRIRAVAGIFDDLAFRDVDDRRSIAVAVPRYDASRLDREFAEPELTPLDICRLLFEIDGGENGVGHALSSVGNRWARVGLHLVGRTTTGNRG